MKVPECNLNKNSAYSPWLIERVCNTGALFLAFVVVSYCIWTLDRGFEITDEAYYLLLAIHSGSQEFYISAQHWITGWLWQITGSMTMFRLAGMVALLVTSILLALGTFSVSLRNGVLEDSCKARLGVVAGSIVSAMLYASTINFSPCYNLIASAGAYAAAGLILLGSQHSSITNKYVFYAFSGCALGAEAICKASAGAATFIILVLWLCVFEDSRSKKIWGTAVVTLGFVMFCGIALLNNTTISASLKAIENGLQLFRIVQTEAIDMRLIRYVVQFSQNIMATFVAFALPLISFAVYVKTRKVFFAIFGLGVLFVTLLFGKYLLGGWDNGNSLTPPFAIVAMLIMALIASIPVWKNDRNLIVLFSGLILLPYSVGMGTGNTLFTQVIVSLAPWGALIGVLMVSRYPKGDGKMPVSLIGFLFITTVSLQIITSGFRPYHMSTALINQDQPFAIGELGVIKVDKATHNFLTDISAAAKECSVSPGAPFLGLYNIPGVALALQAAPVMSPWLNNRAQAEFVINRNHSEKLHSVVIALNEKNTGALPPLPLQLKGFPSNYRYCGMATYPFQKQVIQIWRNLTL